MNLLLSVLRAHAADLPQLEPRETLPASWLAELAEAQSTSVGNLLRAARADVLIGPKVESAFAGVVPLAEWVEAREEGAAEPADPGAFAEWVEIVPLPGGELGITLPEDRLPEPRISLFTRIDGAVRRLSVAVLPGPRPALELRLAGGECGSPYRGRCSGGGCDDCRQRWFDREGAPPAYHCFCADGEGRLTAADAGEVGVTAAEAAGAAEVLTW